MSMFTRDDMEEACTSVRLSFQALMMGAGTSPLELLKASTIKAIKSADNGGPKEKHFLYVMKGLNKEGTYNDGDGGSYSGQGEDSDWGGGEKDGGFIDGTNRRYFKNGGIASLWLKLYNP